MSELTPLLRAAISFAYIGGAFFVAVGLILSFRRGRPHPLLLVCISAISFSWIEAPYDWAVYAQFPPAIPRMPSWWPLNVTWGGLPAAVPPGYIAYFVLPAALGASMGRWLNSKLRWRAPITLLIVGLTIGCLWAFVFNAILGARLGVFYYGHVIEGLALWPGTKHQYPLYDSLAMGVQMMIFTYILGRTDSQGRTAHRGVGGFEVEWPSTLFLPLDCSCRRHRPCGLSFGLRATSRHQVVASADRRAD